MSPRSGYTEIPHGDRQDWHNIRSLLPYLWDFRGRVLIALLCLLLAKLATVGTPLVLKQLIDRLDVDAALGIPLGLLAAYGALRMANTLFNELRDALFAKVRYHAMRRLTVRTLAHLHSLSLRFHLERKTGSINRDLQRGAASLSTLLNYLTFNILPIAIELMLVLGILVTHYDTVFTLIVVISVVIYVVFTLTITNWRMEFRHRMNRLDSKANNEAVDSLINFETVKYFTNEELEVKRYDATLKEWEHSAVLSQTSMSALNFGQGAIIAIGVTLVMFFATAQVLEGAMSLGDLVMVNAFLLQLFLPLNFLGVVYRQIRYSLADMDLLVKLLAEKPEIQDRANAVPLHRGPGELRFEQVDFSYRADRTILSGVDFVVQPGQKVAVVGASGAGKSTLARLLFRFYDVDHGRILIDGQDIREVQQHSLRAAIGIVPQDTVLFNDTLYFNLQYANPQANREDIIAAARLAQLHDFVMSLPQTYETVVGERGLKLSGGEKQRVAIARALLKKPRILVFDEATSALDSAVEQAILQALQRAAAGHTTLAIAHRLSTIVDADQILVLQHGRIIERGTHQQLLAHKGAYSQLWALQQKDRQSIG